MKMISRIIASLLVFSTNVDALAGQTRRQALGKSVGLATGAVVGANVNIDAAHATAAEDWERLQEAERLANRASRTYQSKTMAKLQNAFPGAVPNDALLDRVGRRLQRVGFDRTKTLVASSLCSDEVNRPLEDACRRYYGDNYFSMGGLAGFPFPGVTGFSAMASHIPDGGNCLIIYGPHVGVDSEGTVGKVDRKGKGKTGTCCGSAVAASRAIAPLITGEEDVYGGVLNNPSVALDAQQKYVTQSLVPYAAEIFSAKESMVTLPFATFKPIDNMMNRILAKASTKVGTGQIAMLGGLQINTPDDYDDFFLPLRFDLRDAENNLKDDMLVEMFTGLKTLGGVRPDIDGKL